MTLYDGIYFCDKFMQDWEDKYINPLKWLLLFIAIFGSLMFAFGWR